MKAFLFSITLFASSFSFAVQGTIDEQEILFQLTLREKIGQLCFVAAAIDEKQDKELIENWYDWQPLYHLDAQHVEKMVKDFKVGGIVFYGHHASPDALLKLVNQLQSLNTIPLLMTIDAEMGLGLRLENKSVIKFPYNMTLAATQDLDLIYQVGYEVGRELKLLGLHVNFAPVVDINNNPKNPVIGMRSFGSSKELVANCGIAYMNGLQDAGVIACAKHFPGHGDTAVDSHLALPVINHSVEHLINNEIYPFKKLIASGVKSIMTAHIELPALDSEINLPASLSKKIVFGLLRKDFAFPGLIFTDALGMKGVADQFEPGELELRALQAGNDVLLCPVDVEKAINRIEKAVLQGEISEREINIKLLRVLAAKKWALEHADADLNLVSLSSLKSEQALTLNQTLFDKAMTCLKCEADFLKKLPLNDAVVINTNSDLKEFEKVLSEQTSYTFVDENFKENGFSLSKFFKWFWDSSENSIKKNPHIIIAVSTDSFVEGNTQPLIDRIHTLKEAGKTVTVVLFCSPYLVPELIEADNVILAYESAMDAQISAGKVLSGTLLPEGKLPVVLHE